VFIVWPHPNARRILPKPPSSATRLPHALLLHHYNLLTPQSRKKPPLLSGFVSARSLTSLTLNYYQRPRTTSTFINFLNLHITSAATTTANQRVPSMCLSTTITTTTTSTWMATLLETCHPHQYKSLITSLTRPPLRQPQPRPLRLPLLPPASATAGRAPAAVSGCRR